MKASDNFTKIITTYLHNLAKKDSLFAETLKKPNKNITDCITYIFKTVKNSGCNGFADEEIYGMAVHYYDEDDIKPGSVINAKVVVNHTISTNKKAVSISTTQDPVGEFAPAKKKPIKKLEIVNQPSLF